MKSAAAITQADIARIIRAAKQTGVKVVEFTVRDTTVRMIVTPETDERIPLAQKPIVL